MTSQVLGLAGHGLGLGLVCNVLDSITGGEVLLVLLNGRMCLLVCGEGSDLPE